MCLDIISLNCVGFLVCPNATFSMFTQRGAMLHYQFQLVLSEHYMGHLSWMLWLR